MFQLVSIFVDPPSPRSNVGAGPYSTIVHLHFALTASKILKTTQLPIIKDIYYTGVLEVGIFLILCRSKSYIIYEKINNKVISFSNCH